MIAGPDQPAQLGQTPGMTALMISCIIISIQHNSYNYLHCAMQSLPVAIALYSQKRGQHYTTHVSSSGWNHL